MMASPFAIDLYRRAAAAEGNVVLSPYSIAIALRMLLAGARGETAGEIARVLGNASSAPAADVLSANALWIKAGYPFEAAFASTLKRDFDALVEALDFAQNKAAAARINGWVSDQTRGMIENLVSPDLLDELTALVLTNAVYLKARWQKPFDTDDTQDDVFHLAGGGEVPVKMMERRLTLSAAKIRGGRVFEMPYAAELSMLICLPDAIDGLAEIERSFDPAAWRLEPRPAKVFLPRFSAGMRLDVAEILQKMGIRRAFRRGEADLSGITAEEPLWVSAVLHQGRIDVDEEGTEAAAATAILVLRAAAPRPRPIEEFRVDRPFLFLIRSKRGEVVFIGRVADPAARS